MEYLINIGILVTIYAILGVSLNLIVGYSGLLSLTHAAFFGTGAYTTAILLTRFSVNFFVALPVGMLCTALLALVIGVVLSKFDDDYYALGSFGANVILFSVFLNWQSLTRGPLGIPGIDRPQLFGFSFSDNLVFFILSLILLCLVYAAAQFVVTSSFGRVLTAIREDEEAIAVFGYRTLFYKLTVFVIGAALAAVAGSLMASYITFIDPSSFGLVESVFMLAIIILGGLGDLRGSVAGAAFLIILPEALRFVGLPADAAAQLRLMMYGLMLILLMLYRPQGLLGKYRM